MKAVICYVNGGYKIDNGSGQFMYDGRIWKTLEEVEAFAKSENLDYEIV